MTHGTTRHAVQGCLATGPPASYGRRLAAVAIVLVVVAGLSVGAAHNMRFDRISLEHGLSQSAVNAIVQDHRGFMWFATEDGLNRFDGYNFVTFKNDPDDPGSLSHNFVRTLLVDRHGRIWVGTEGGGLNLWDETQARFVRFRQDDSRPDALGLDRVRSLHEDPTGALWIGTDGGGINRFVPETGSWSRYVNDPENAASVGHDRIRAIVEDRQGGMWFGTYGGGLSRLEDDGRFRTYRHDPADATSLSDDRVYSLYEDRQGNLWVGTYGGGLNRLDPDTGRFERFQHDPANMRGIGPGRIRTVFEDHAGTLWIGTDGGLMARDADTGAFERFEHDPADSRSLSSNRVTALLEDRGGVLWIGTRDNGLNKWHPLSGLFELHRMRDGLAADMVMAFAHDDDHLWIGTFGGGLNRLDRATGEYTYYRHDPRDPGSLADDRVMSLLIDRRGNLWVGTFEGGLQRLDRDSGRFARPVAVTEDPIAVGSFGIMALYEGADGLLWIGTFEGGLHSLNLDTEVAVSYRHHPSATDSLGSDRVTCFAEDGDVLWVGTDGGGLNRFDRRTRTFRRFRHDPDDPASLGSDVVWSLHLDPRGTLWIGTQGSGLNRWDAPSRRADRADFEKYMESDGLPNNQVYGIVGDEDGRLWISTNRGLSRLDLETNEFKNFDTTRGLQSNEFNFGAYHRAADGEMFFGGIRGFNAFRPSEIRDNEHVPPVVLTSFQKLNREVDLDTPLSQIEEIVLDHTDDVVSFEFAALDFVQPDKNRYAYRLEGFDRDWNDLGEARRATYTNLDAGDYVLRVRGSNNDGVWGEGAALRVRVLPPPWKTWWAYTIYGITLAVVVFGLIRAQARKFEREAEYSRKLEREVEVRTEELADRNRELLDANSKLEEASLTDSLTGFRNRRFLFTEIDRAISMTERFYASGDSDRRTPTAAEADFLFLMIDLDGLKKINDTFGHDAGDRALLHLRDLLQAVCRRSDTLIRWGGDEFLVVARNVDLKHGEALAERLRRSVAGHGFDIGARTVRLSCSIGFACYPFLGSEPTVVNWQNVVTIADRAMYLAKTSGRNAWAYLESTDKSPRRDLVERVNDDLERLVETGGIALKSSIEPRAVVLSRS